MTFGVLLRFCLVWLLLPAVLLAMFLYSQSVSSLDESRPIGVHVAMLGGSALAMPCIALAAALTAARLRYAGYVRGRPGRRGVWPRIVPPVATIGIVGSAAVLGVTAVSGPAHGASWWIDPRLVASTIASSLSYAAVGFALGATLRGIFAAPAALLTPYVLIGFPPAMEPLWLRHLTSLNTSCCSVSQDLSASAWSSHMLAMAGLGMAAMGVTAIAVGGRRQLLAVPVGAAALVAAVVVAHGLPAGPTDPRPGSPRCSGAPNAEVCLWPEDDGVRSTAEAFYAQARRVADRTGVTMSPRFTESEPAVARPNDTLIKLSPRSSPEELRGALLTSLFPGPSQACIDSVETGTDPDTTGEAQVIGELARSWWAEQLGDPANTPSADLVEPQLMRRWRRMPAQERITRINAADHDIRACRPPQGRGWLS